MPGIEILVDFHVDLLAACVRIRAGSETQGSAGVGGTQPLVYRRIEAIATVKDVRMRHEVEILLADSAWIQLRAVCVPRCALDNCVGTIRPHRRIDYGT